MESSVRAPSANPRGRTARDGRRIRARLRPVRHLQGRSFWVRERWEGWRGRSGGRRWRAIRRCLALVLLVLAGWLALRDAALAPGVVVVAVTRDLEIGATLTAADVELIKKLEPPPGAISDIATVVGRVAGGPVQQGEIITQTRLVDRFGPDPGPGRLAVPVRLTDEAVAARLRPGMKVRLIGVADSGLVTVLTPDALVLTQFDARASPAGPLLLSVAAGEADRVTAGSLLGQLAVQFV